MASNGSASTEEENNLAYLLDQGKVKTLQEFKTRIERVNDLNLLQPIIDGVVHLCCCLLPKISKSFYSTRVPNQTKRMPRK